MRTKKHTNKVGLGVGHPDTRRVSISLDNDLWRELEKQAIKEGLPVSVYIRTILSDKYGITEN